MELGLRGKRALVCGSSQGIGKAVAEALAALGASVSLFARNRAALESVKEGLEANSGHQILVADFSRPEDVEAVLREHMAAVGEIHILIANTGGPAPGPAHMATAKDFTQAFTQHLIVNQLLVSLLWEGMRSAGYGRIINILSTSVKQPISGLGVSNTIRGAVASWAKTLASELGPYGITVNNVLPGATSTQRLDAILANKAQKQNKSLLEITKAEKATIPLARFGRPEELANAVAFLASPAASYITGINLPVDGGRTSCL